MYSPRFWFFAPFLARIAAVVILRKAKDLVRSERRAVLCESNSALQRDVTPGGALADVRPEPEGPLLRVLESSVLF